MISFVLSISRKRLIVRAGLLGVACSALFLSGCSIRVNRTDGASHLPAYLRPARREFRESTTVKPTIGEPKSASVGERLFVKGAGAWFRYPKMKMNSGVTVELPARGAVKGKTVKFEIQRTTLNLKYQSDKHLYFCAPRTLVSCESNLDSYKSRLPNVIIGVLKSKQTARLHWFVLLPSTSFWVPSQRYSRPVKPEDELVETWEDIAELDPGGEWVALYYGGFVDGKIHFELEESKGPDANVRREFKFNLNKDGSPTRIGVKDFVFDILKVDNVKLNYRWVSIE